MNELSKTRKPLTHPQRLSLEMGHVIGKYKLGTARRPEDVKWDLVCRIHDYLQYAIKDFDSDGFMDACGYTGRKV